MRSLPNVLAGGLINSCRLRFRGDLRPYGPIHRVYGIASRYAELLMFN